MRPPKTGSTSLVFYFFKSGLLDKNKDVYEIDGPFTNWKDFEEYNKKYGDNSAYTHTIKNLSKKRKNVHTTFNQLLEKNLIKETMPCVATIRHPLERFSSAFYFVKAQNPKFYEGTPYDNPNSFWDSLKNKEPKMGVRSLAVPQCDYFPAHATLFNTENLHEHASKYILERGGKVDNKIQMRKNIDNNLDEFLSALTPDRQQDLLDTYSEDFVLWEKAYAVYN